MESNSNKKANGNGEHTSVSRMLTAAWLITLALVIVFAKDLNQWAVAAESVAVQQNVRPATDLVLDVAQWAGVVQARQGIEGVVHGFYDDPYMVGGRDIASMPVVATAGTATTAAQADPPADAEKTNKQNNAVSDKFRPTRVLIVGDSSIQSGLGTKLERQLETYEGITVERFGQHSTGLARPDYFDWNVKLIELMDEFGPDMVIAYWGDNDCQGLSTVDGEFIAHFGTDEWDAEYGNRMEAIVNLIHERDSKAVIIGMPIMRAKSFSKRIERLNQVVQNAVEKADGFYLPTWDMCADEDGKYMSSVEFQGKTRIIRAGDGIHLSSHGAAYVADGICKVLEENYLMVPGPTE